jgi:hypothetical protein
VLPAATGLVCRAAFFGFGRAVGGAGAVAFFGFGRAVGGAGAVAFFGFGRAVGAAAAVDCFGFGRAGTAAAAAAALGFGGALVGVALFAVALAFATGGLAITLAVPAGLGAGLVARLGGATGAPARLTTTRGVLLPDEATETFESAVFRPADAPRAGVFLALPFGSAI